jgi:hypothetical protein
MKYQGKKLEGRNTDVLVLRTGERRIVLKFEAVESFEAFDALATIPEPPEVLRPGGKKTKNVKDPKYIEQLADFAELKTSWLVVTSLKVTDDLEWDTVDYEDPATWNNWSKEMGECGFSETERMHIVNKVAQVNTLDDGMLQQARSDFLLEASQEEK